MSRQTCNRRSSGSNYSRNSSADGGRGGGVSRDQRHHHHPYVNDESRGNRGFGNRPMNSRDFTEIDISAMENLQIVSENELPKEVATNGEVVVEINGFALDLQNAKDIWMYDIKFEGKRNGKENMIDLSRHRNNDAARNLKFTTLGQLFGALLQSNSQFFHQDTNDSPMFVYDRSQILYSSLDLLPNDDEGNKKFILDQEHLFQLEDRTYTRNFEEISVTLQKTAALKISEYATADKNTRSQIQAYVAVLTNQAKLTDFWIFDEKMYRKISVIPVHGQQQFVIKEGLQKGARAIATEKGDSVEMMLQVDAKKAAFYAPMNLIDFILENNRGWRIGDLENPGNWEQMLEQLRYISVESTHLEFNKRFVIANISTLSAVDSYFVKDGERISVAEHFASQKLILKYPHFPCIMESNNANAAKFPLEVLNVSDGQRVPQNKISGELTNIMLKRCQQKPAELVQLIKNEVDGLELNNSNEYLKHAGIRFVKSGQFVKTQAKLLPPPVIVYANKQLQLSSSLWKPDGSQFLQPAHIPKLAIIARDEHIARNYGRRLVDMSRQFGMQIDLWNYVQLDTENDKHEIAELCKDLARRRYTFLFFIADSAILHSAIKYAEIPTSIPTQQMKIFSTKKGPDTTKNIILKFNLKAGGKNHTIASAPELSILKGTSDRKQYDMVKSILKSAIVIGLEMSHPFRVKIDPNSNVQRHEPTCVGICATVDEYANSQSGGYFYQNGGTTIIEGIKLADKILDSIKGYHLKNQSYPKNVIIYRSGLSEGQFPVAAEKECETLKLKLDSFYASVECSSPKISVIAVQRKTNYRIFKPSEELEKFFGTNAPAHVQNVTPGTTVLQRGTNPEYKEFLMVPQKALLGTAKPIVGTVIFESPAYSTNIEHMAALSNSLCYMHEICTSSISIPAPLKSAQQLATRGKNNWIHHSRIFAENGSPPAGAAVSNAGNLTEEEMEEFKAQAGAWFNELSEELKVKIPGKFWA